MAAEAEEAQGLPPPPLVFSPTFIHFVVAPIHRQCGQNISNFDFFSVAGDYGAGDSRRSTTDNERAPFHRFQRRRRLREKIAPDCLFSPPPPPLIITPLIFTVFLSPTDSQSINQLCIDDYTHSALCSLLLKSSQSCTLLELCIFSPSSNHR